MISDAQKDRIRSLVGARDWAALEEARDCIPFLLAEIERLSTWVAVEPVSTGPLSDAERRAGGDARWDRKPSDYGRRITELEAANERIGRGHDLLRRTVDQVHAEIRSRLRGVIDRGDVQRWELFLDRGLRGLPTEGPPVDAEVKVVPVPRDTAIMIEGLRKRIAELEAVREIELKKANDLTRDYTPAALGAYVSALTSLKDDDRTPVLRAITRRLGKFATTYAKEFAQKWFRFGIGANIVHDGPLDPIFQKEWKRTEVEANSTFVRMRIDALPRFGGLIVDDDPDPIPMLLYCPRCNVQHVDVTRLATHPHRDHQCHKCGLTWRPAKVPTVGVQFLYPPDEDERMARGGGYMTFDPSRHRVVNGATLNGQRLDAVYERPVGRANPRRSIAFNVVRQSAHGVDTNEHDPGDSALPRAERIEAILREWMIHGDGKLAVDRTIANIRKTLMELDEERFASVRVSRDGRALEWNEF